MKNLILLLALASSVLLASCGGSGAAAPSPFQGNFSGSWTSDGPDIGTAQIGVQSNGTFSGSETDTTISLHGTVSGHLTNSGTFAGTVTPDGGAPLSASGEFHISNDGNTLSGTVTFSGVNYNYTLNRI